MIADMLNNKKLSPIVTELFIRGRELNIYIMKIHNKRELQQIAFNHSSDIEFNDFMNLSKTIFAKPSYFLVIDTMLRSDNP